MFTISFTRNTLKHFKQQNKKQNNQIIESYIIKNKDNINDATIDAATKESSIDETDDETIYIEDNLI